MAEDKADTEVKHPQAHPPFVEVECRSSGKVLRFSSGTEAGFAVNLINKRLLKDNDSDSFENVTLVSHIEAVKEGEEEPVGFGPNSVLAKYGPAWKLQTVEHSYGDKWVHIEPARVRKVSAKYLQRLPNALVPEQGLVDSHSARSKPQSRISFMYVGKILLTFVLLFMLGAVFTMVLENLPRFILYINSSV
ncbi:uncharacterized protein [Primulina huaijiensis]|uniref:uncharacterized protein isoform X1 n=1 Tax=Primulina huaijiensis TaxID=1492673 RepID=UPI003CC70C62